MGWFMQEHDIYIGSILEELNLRFAPTQDKEGHHGGIAEMAELQGEFKIFKKGRTFAKSVSVLNLGMRNNEVKNRWLALLNALDKHPSNVKGKNGDQAIVEALIKNLAAKKPLPVYFTSHSMAGGGDDSQVKVTHGERAVHYIEQDYIVVSLPMQSVQAAGAARSAKKSGAKKK